MSQAASGMEPVLSTSTTYFHYPHAQRPAYKSSTAPHSKLNTGVTPNPNAHHEQEREREPLQDSIISSKHPDSEKEHSQRPVPQPEPATPDTHNILRQANVPSVVEPSSLSRRPSLYRAITSLRNRSARRMSSSVSSTGTSRPLLGAASQGRDHDSESESESESPGQNPGDVGVRALVSISSSGSDGKPPSVFELLYRSTSKSSRDPSDAAQKHNHVRKPMMLQERKGAGKAATSTGMRSDGARGDGARLPARTEKEESGIPSIWMGCETEAEVAKCKRSSPRTNHVGERSGFRTGLKTQDRAEHGGPSAPAERQSPPQARPANTLDDGRYHALTTDLRVFLVPYHLKPSEVPGNRLFLYAIPEGAETGVSLLEVVRGEGAAQVSGLGAADVDVETETEGELEVEEETETETGTETGTHRRQREPAELSPTPAAAAPSRQAGKMYSLHNLTSTLDLRGPSAAGSTRRRRLGSGNQDAMPPPPHRRPEAPKKKPSWNQPATTPRQHFQTKSPSASSFSSPSSSAPPATPRSPSSSSSASSSTPTLMPSPPNDSPPPRSSSPPQTTPGTPFHPGFGGSRIASTGSASGKGKMAVSDEAPSSSPLPGPLDFDMLTESLLRARARRDGGAGAGAGARSNSTASASAAVGSRLSRLRYRRLGNGGADGGGGGSRGSGKGDGDGFEQ
ncbi:hypothetical protein BDV95DRAFT_607070 [Massariosphaeria phaeospora]|uniref:Uncharacterized protein n=1 Tax=Massariosphaeria phaeospora TaxID=100035 RepID=A0A7C8I9R4_9PLEO|nr:hypothetical protein BDV95DRAFT_607070 [Massariosphaeria phaeospora]